MMMNFGPKLDLTLLKIPSLVKTEKVQATDDRWRSSAVSCRSCNRRSWTARWGPACRRSCKPWRRRMGRGRAGSLGGRDSNQKWGSKNGKNLGVFEMLDVVLEHDLKFFENNEFEFGIQKIWFSVFENLDSNPWRRLSGQAPDGPQSRLRHRQPGDALRGLQPRPLGPTIRIFGRCWKMLKPSTIDVFLKMLFQRFIKDLDPKAIWRFVELTLFFCFLHMNVVNWILRWLIHIKYVQSGSTGLWYVTMFFHRHDVMVKTIVEQ